MLTDSSWFQGSVAAVTPVAGATWCVVVALVILAVLLLDAHLTQAEMRRRQ